MYNDKKVKVKEDGAIVITVAFLLCLLLGFLGLALDFGHLFVIRTELQTAKDACALAGAQELNGQSDALTRARNAGVAAANANNVDLQSASWSGKPKVTVADVSFRDTNQIVTTDYTKARYVRCSHVQAGTSNAANEATRAGARYAVVYADPSRSGRVLAKMQALMPQITSINVVWSPVGCDASSCESVTVSLTGMSFKWITPVPGGMAQPVVLVPGFTTYLPREMMSYNPLIC